MEKRKKMKILDVSGSFVACDLKVGRYRQHTCIEVMKLRLFLDLGKRSFTY